jgi:hypothetical protein
VAGADGASTVVHGAERPRFGERAHQSRRERWCARIARLEFVQPRRQIAGETRAVHTVLPQYESKVGIRGVQQFDEEVLHLHVVVRSAQAEPRRAFNGTARLVVQLCNEGPEINVHYAALT